MRRIIIWANTYYQLLMAIQMKLSLFKEDYVHLLISNHSNRSENVYKSLREIHVFNDISYIESKGAIQKRNKKSKFKELFDLSFGKDNEFYYYLDNIEDLMFDEMISFNFEIDTYAVYAILSRYNSKLEYSSYEEGLLSYENIYYDSPKFRCIRTLRKLVGKSNITDYYTKFYCTHPELYNGKLNTIKIPDIKVEDEFIRSVLAKVFDVKSTIDYRNYKYVYFESIYETEGRSIGELDLLRALVDHVGKENILVKKHPRSTVLEYEKMGIDVDINSTAPFEAIQINNDMSHCIFVAAASGSVLTVNSMIDNPSEVRLFYPMTRYNNFPDIEKYIMHVDAVVSELKKKGSLQHVRVVSKIDEIIN